MGHADRLAEWNATAVAYEDRDSNLAVLVRRAVERHAGLVAVIDGAGTEWTYAEFDRIVDGLTAALQAANVSIGSRVGVHSRRSMWMVAALHAVVRAGGAWVPLDPEIPAERLRYMIEETGMSVVLADDDLPTLEGVEVVGIRRPVDARPMDVDISPSNAAYVIYTSGSTGRPKGVENGHRGIVNRLLWMQSEYGLGPGNTVLQKTPYSFDVSVWEFFWPLMVGATLVVARHDGHKDPTHLVEIIQHHGVDTIHFVPSMLRLFLEHPGARSCTSLRRVICSGEALTRDLADRFFAVLPGTELHNLYGPTEAAVDVTAHQCQPDDERAVVPIGRPIANTTIHVLDDEDREVAVGDVGELHIGGVQVAHGYVNRPDLTAERFVEIPPFGRMYRTGDLARWTDDGTIEFLGRIDHQIKLRGQRIELGEIESTLGEHPGVIEAAVLAVTERDSMRLHAHVMVRAGVATDPGVLREHLAQRLPAVMIPERWSFHTALPLTTSGKVDRNALADRAVAAPVAPAPEPPAVGSDPLESHLLDIWRDLLGRPDLAVDEHVLDAGANSLDAARFVNHIQEELGEFIYVVTVFTAPTIAQYADFLRREYAEAVARKFGVRTPDGSSDSPLTVEELSTVADALPRFGAFPAWERGDRIDPMVFILAPPRSGTTLLRVMLAGHPGLFAASELHLLEFDTLAARREAYSDARDRVWLEGTIRMLMELDESTVAEAFATMDRLADAGMTAKEFLRSVQERLAGRTLVDKSPSYALDLEVLRNAERGVTDARYIHLVRDAVAVSRSFESYHMDQVLHLDRTRTVLAGRHLGEAIWTLSHRTILRFAAEVPDERFHRVQFEDLVTRPESTMSEVAAFLGLEFVPAMADPYQDLAQRMVDGIHPESTPMGDTRFLEHRQVDPGAATRWDGGGVVLGDATERVLASLRGETVRRRAGGRRR